MTSLLRRAATCAGLAVSGFATLSQAQSTTVVMPERTQLRRALPVAGQPVIQQSPNGLFSMSITDTGIVLRGPQGVVKITDTGIQIGDPRTAHVTLDAANVDLKGSQAVSLAAGRTMDIKASQTMNIKGDVTVQITNGYASMNLEPGLTSLTGPRVALGCTNGKPAARTGDVVNTSASPAVILSGSSTVLVC